MTSLTLERLVDPIVEQHGHHVTSLYVKTFWLSVLGPSALWVLRRSSRLTTGGPIDVDADVLAGCIGLGPTAPWHSSALARTLRRLVDYQAGQRATDTHWLLRSHLGPLPERRAKRLPAVLARQLDVTDGPGENLELHLAPPDV